MSRRRSGLESAFRALLLLYPPGFRRRHGPEMEAVFEQELSSVSDRRGRLGVAIRALRDTAVNAPALWIRAAWWAVAGGPGGGGRRGGGDGWAGDGWTGDARHALRALRRSPGFAATATSTLAVGVGANVALFSLLYPVLLAPLPFEDGERVVMVLNAPRPGTRFVGLSDPFFAELARGPHPFEEVGAFSPVTVNVGGTDRPERVDALRVSGGFFGAVRVAPLLGRTLGPGDDRPGRDDAVVISHGLWTRRFGGDPAAVGSVLRVDDRSRTVVGVLPPRFRFFSGAELWIPLAVDPARLDDPAAAVNNNRGAVALLPEGAPTETVASGLERVGERLRARFPGATEPSHSLAVRRYREWATGDVRGGLLTLAGAVGLVLLVACANLANLLLVRHEARAPELAVRAALGAGRRRLTRLLLAESLVLSAAGAVAGLGVGRLALLALAPLIPPGLGLEGPASVGLPTLAFTLALGLGTGVVFGVAPALGVVRRSLAAGSGTRGAVEGRTPVRSLLVGAQIAAAAVLLVGSGLLLRSMVELGRVDPGFRVEDGWAMDVALPASAYPDDAAARAFFRELTAAAAALPSVAETAVGQWMPLEGGVNWGYTVEDRPDRGVGFADYNLVGPEWFATMGIPVLEGRALRWDDAEGEGAVVVSRSMARRLWPGESAVGRRVNVDVDGTRWRTVVGVVADVRNRTLAAEPPDLMYFPPESLPFAGPRSMTLVLRTPGGPPPAAALAELLASLDPAVPFEAPRPLSRSLARSEAERRFLGAILGAFAALTLGLAAVGLYGVVAYGVSLRRREIGVRVAMGADRASVRRLFLRQGAIPVAGGLAAGLGAAAALSRLLASTLFGVAPLDPATYAAVAAFLAAVAAAATAVPAARAAHVDPVEALAAE